MVFGGDLNVRAGSRALQPAECPRMARRAGRRGRRPPVRARLELDGAGHQRWPAKTAGSAAQRWPAAATFRSQSGRCGGDVRCVVSCPPSRGSRFLNAGTCGPMPQAALDAMRAEVDFRCETPAHQPGGVRARVGGRERARAAAARSVGAAAGRRGADQLDVSGGCHGGGRDRLAAGRPGGDDHRGASRDHAAAGDRGRPVRGRGAST